MTFNLPLYKNFGAEIKQLSPDLANQLSQMYTDIATSIAQAVNKDVIEGADPAAVSQRNALFSIGDITIRTDTNKAWIMTSRTDDETVVWTLIT